MAQGLFNYPHPTKERGQRSIDIGDLYLTRFTPPWSRPPSASAYQWRAWVLQQPVAIVCRETHIANILSLDWKITPRDSSYREELEGTIKHYTKLISKGGNYDELGLDYAGLIEWLAGDLLDTPFGMAAELGRKGDEPGGRVVWIRPLDAGTLYPTLNAEYPVVQYYAQPYDAVAFPSWSISRTYMSPHTFIYREGWGMPPPEKIYFALELLNRGDKYYANLLLDIPTAGILDLGDMEKDAAVEWITAFKTFVQDQNQSFRVPVLYEHNNPIEFIPFGKEPNNIMFDRITMKYAALVAASYGMSLSDIGLQTTTASGETLAGSIRQERRTRKTGFARVKAKLKAFFDNILPDTLEFNFVDYDDELNVALGRARLASSQAFSSWRQMGLFSKQELRSQAIQDGLVSITMPDELPPDAEPDLQADPNAEPELLQGGTAPSMGGEGEVKSLDSVSFKSKVSSINNSIEKLVLEIAPKIYGVFSDVREDDVEILRSMISDAIFSEEDTLEILPLITDVIGKKSFGDFQFSKLDKEFEGLLEELNITGVNVKSHTASMKQHIRDNFPTFLSRAVTYVMVNSEYLLDSVNEDYEVDFSCLVQDVQARIHKSLTDYVSAHVGIEVQKTLKEIADGKQEIPEVLRIRSVTKIQTDAPVPVIPNITLPEITVNVPEGRTNVDVESPVVHLHNTMPQPNISISNQIPEQKAPEVHVGSPVVNVEVPKQETPIVNLSLPDAPAPVVNVNNQVNPTPVEIVNPVTVNVPRTVKTKAHQDVNRDANGYIRSTDEETEYKYDEEKGIE